MLTWFVVVVSVAHYSNNRTNPHYSSSELKLPTPLRGSGPTSTVEAQLYYTIYRLEDKPLLCDSRAHRRPLLHLFRRQVLEEIRDRHAETFRHRRREGQVHQHAADVSGAEG